MVKWPSLKVTPALISPTSTVSPWRSIVLAGKRLSVFASFSLTETICAGAAAETETKAASVAAAATRKGAALRAPVEGGIGKAPPRASAGQREAAGATLLRPLERDDEVGDDLPLLQRDDARMGRREAVRADDQEVAPGVEPRHVEAARRRRLDLVRVRQRLRPLPPRGPRQELRLDARIVGRPAGGNLDHVDVVGIDHDRSAPLRGDGAAVDLRQVAPDVARVVPALQLDHELVAPGRD